MTGKGSNPRPFSVNRKKFDDNYEAIFGKKKENPDIDPETGSVRYKAHPETGEMIPDYMWSQLGMLPKPVPRTPHIMRDTGDYVSPATGKHVSGRKQRRYDLESSGCRPYEGGESERRAANAHRVSEDRKLSQSMEKSMGQTLSDIQHQNNAPIERSKKGAAKNTFTFGD